MLATMSLVPVTQELTRLAWGDSVLISPLVRVLNIREIMTRPPRDVVSAWWQSLVIASWHYWHHASKCDRRSSLRITNGRANTGPVTPHPGSSSLIITPIWHQRTSNIPCSRFRIYVNKSNFIVSKYFTEYYRWNSNPCESNNVEPIWVLYCSAFIFSC